MSTAGALQATDPWPTRRAARIEPERLASCVRRLDPADRALLDLSLNRRLSDDQLAPLVRTEPIRLAWRRARAIERIASRLAMTHPSELPEVRAALSRLPSSAWLPLELQPAPEQRAIKPPEPTGMEIRITRTTERRATSLPGGGITSFAQRTMPRKAMTAHAKRTLGTALIGVAVGFLLKRR